MTPTELADRITAACIADEKIELNRILRAHVPCILTALRAAPAVPEWIEVSDRLPEATSGEEGKAPIISDDVLVWFTAGDSQYEIAYYDHDDEKWVIAQGFYIPDADPTHWMPLPKPPLAASGKESAK